MFRWLQKRNVLQTVWWAGAYLTNERIVIHSASRIRSGIGWYNQPVFVAANNASNDVVGEQMRKAVNASIWDSLKDDSQDTEHPIFHAAGVKNWRGLENQSKRVSIETDKQVVRILPSRWVTKDEGGRGFIGLLESPIEVRWDSSDADLGSALRRGFEVSRTRAERE